jgi:hypothetical protein
MPLYFNSVLAQHNLRPEDVVLLRHQDHRDARGTPYEMWRDNRATFESYQSAQSPGNKAKLARAPLWASFVVDPSGVTLFAGLYSVKYLGKLQEDRGNDKAGEAEDYELVRDHRFADLEGRLVIEWGAGTRAWIQRADSQNKNIVELRSAFKEEEFPGYLNFVKSLSGVLGVPKTWAALLKNAKGVYLLTCPKTKEQYVGSAAGEEGFWQRWMEYVPNGHGNNVALKSKEPSDYRVSILELAGSNANVDDILKMETRWKQKLQSREMGLNKN